MANQRKIWQNRICATLRRKGKGSYLNERLTVQGESSTGHSRVHGEQYSRVERESGAAQRGRRRQFYWESFTETD